MLENILILSILIICVFVIFKKLSSHESYCGSCPIKEKCKTKPFVCHDEGENRS